MIINISDGRAMNYLNIYYSTKKYIPRNLQIVFRRLIAKYKRIKYFDVWPIDPDASVPPVGWKKWPENKKFALILTHDVDTKKGYENVTRLMEIEKKLDFRSSFNFVPEGYPVDKQFINFLRQQGFDVGVHGLTHEGKMYLKKDNFSQIVPKINYYLKSWESAGFHSPSMLVHLDWIGDLEVEYDCSTFDSDPFEPINYGVKTIFPFLVNVSHRKHDFVELPYTLPQDHTLFIVLREKNTNIWKKKLAWIAANGGMVFVNTHPDYMRFIDSNAGSESYPSEYYEEFLEFIKNQYKGQYWNVLPREMAAYVKKHFSDFLQPQVVLDNRNGAPRQSKSKGKIWIDLDNSPHVPFFRPIINELEKRGFRILITARDNAQTCELADRYLINYLRVGKHFGANKFIKVISTLFRSLILAVVIKKKNPLIAISHGSRAQVIACALLRIPSIGLSDYEYAVPLGKSDWLISPEIISSVGGRKYKNGILHFPGIKEDVYIPFFSPDLKLRTSLGIKTDEILVTIRPPATEAHYHNPESETLFEYAVNWLRSLDQVRMIILPRYESQIKYIKNKWPEEIKSEKIIIPSEVLDGLNLMWNSDLVISGGGTMNREAAALHIPVYSIFRGKLGAVDRWLNQQGRLEIISSIDDIKTKIKIVKRVIKAHPEITKTPALSAIITHIENIISLEKKERQY